MPQSGGDGSEGAGSGADRALGGRGGAGTAHLGDPGGTAEQAGAGTSDVVVLEDVAGAGIARLEQRWRLVADPDGWADPERLRTVVAGTRALVVRNRTQVTSDVLRAAPKLQVVARAGVGLDNVDVVAADELGVVVVAAIGANAQSVGEHAVALALALARDVVGHCERVRRGAWERAAGLELAGGTWGVIGLGATGQATARLAAAMGMSVLGYDPFLSPEAPVADAACERVDRLPVLLSRADVVSLHLAASDETQAMVDAEFLGAMRPGAFLVNVARGSLVDEAALLSALDDGRIGGAGLDVRATEPPGPDPLAVHPRVVSTPHVAGITTAAQERVVDMIAADVDRVLAGADARHPVGRHRRPA